MKAEADLGKMLALITPGEKSRVEDVLAELNAEPIDPEPDTQVGQKRKIPVTFGKVRRSSRMQEKNSTSAYRSFSIECEKDDSLMLLKERVSCCDSVGEGGPETLSQIYALHKRAAPWLQRLFHQGIEHSDNQATLSGVGMKTGDVVWLLETQIAIDSEDDEVQCLGAATKKPRGPERAGFVGSILGADASLAKSASPAALSEATTPVALPEATTPVALPGTSTSPALPESEAPAALHKSGAPTAWPSATITGIEIASDFEDGIMASTHSAEPLDKGKPLWLLIRDRH